MSGATHHQKRASSSLSSKRNSGTQPAPIPDLMMVDAAAPPLPKQPPAATVLVPVPAPMAATATVAVQSSLGTVALPPPPPVSAAPPALPPVSAAPQPISAAPPAVAQPLPSANIDTGFQSAARVLLALAPLLSVNPWARPLAKRAAQQSYDACAVFKWQIRQSINTATWRKAVEQCVAMRSSAIGKRYLNPKHEFIVLCSSVCYALEQSADAKPLIEPFQEALNGVAPPGASPNTTDLLAAEYAALTMALRVETATMLSPVDIGLSAENAVLVDFAAIYKAITVQ